MKIRVIKVYSVVEMLSGQYARSEGPWVEDFEVYVHPNDIKFIVDDRAEAAAAANAQVGRRDWWGSTNDVEEAAEDGDPLAHKWFEAYYEYRHTHFEYPEFEEITGSADGWTKLPPFAKIRKE